MPASCRRGLGAKPNYTRLHVLKVCVICVLVRRLQKRFGRFIKFKNGFALPEEEAEKQFHLRKCLVGK